MRLGFIPNAVGKATPPNPNTGKYLKDGVVAAGLLTFTYDADGHTGSEISQLRKIAPPGPGVARQTNRSRRQFAGMNSLVK